MGQTKGSQSSALIHVGCSPKPRLRPRQAQGKDHRKTQGGEEGGLQDQPYPLLTLNLWAKDPAYPLLLFKPASTAPAGVSAEGTSTGLAAAPISYGLVGRGGGVLHLWLGRPASGGCCEHSMTTSSPSPDV